jgi:hypothetical protein
VGAKRRARIIPIVSHASSAPQAPSVWPRWPFSELVGTRGPNTAAIAFDSATSPIAVAVPCAFT